MEKICQIKFRNYFETFLFSLSKNIKGRNGESTQEG